jgi:putative ABC transport system permease protein
MQKTERTFTVPAIEVLTGAVPTDVLVGPAFLARPDVASSLAVGRIDTSVYTVPSVPDAADRPSFQDRVQLELYRGEVAGGLWQGQTVTDPQLITLLIAGFGTALMALLAGLMVTALSLADGKADVATLAAVGAPPRVRRRMAAASAGYVSLIGCIAGAASGGLAGWVLIPLLNGATTWRTPWAMVLVVAVGVPLLTAAVAWLTTRNRIGLTRRLDT